LEQAHDLEMIFALQRARLVLTARAHRDLGEVSVASNVASRALATAEEAGDTWAMGWSLHVLIVVAIIQGDVAVALPMSDRALNVVVDNPALNDLSLLMQINKAVALGNSTGTTTRCMPRRSWRGRERAANRSRNCLRSSRVWRCR
jgi:hypothetical protein